MRLDEILDLIRDEEEGLRASIDASGGSDCSFAVKTHDNTCHFTVGGEATAQLSSVLHGLSCLRIRDCGANVD